MTKCLICGKEFKKLSYHLFHKHKEISQKEYYDKFILQNKPKCEFCNTEVPFINVDDGYKLNCNNEECVKKRIKKTNLEKYGCENNFKNKELMRKAMKTKLEKYGTSNNSEKTKQTNLEKYGTTCSLNYNPNREKTKQTNLEKYGVDNPLKSKELMVNSNNKKLDKYGSNNNILKMKKTYIDKYGVDNPFKNKELMNTVIKIRKNDIDENGLNSYNRAILKTSKTSKINFYNNVILKLDKIEPLFTEEEYHGSNSIYYKWLCNECNKEFEYMIGDGRYPICPKCNPYKYSSKGENELYDWISNYITDVNNIDKCKQYFKDGKKLYELDVLIKSKNIAIEYNGIYWHSELGNNKNKSYHINKTNWFKNNHNIDIIHVFENEWIFKKEIIKSLILARLGISSKIIYGRNCEIKNVNNIKEFLDNNHIQGYVPSNINYGLYYDDELVSLMTFGKSRFNKSYKYEMLRFCNKLNTKIHGGFSKLLNKFIKDYGNELITYCDKRLFSGNVYETNGFKLIGNSNPNYFYTKNYINLENRMKFQKHKLKNLFENFNPELTEWENLKINGYDRIWDCGNLIYTLKP